MNDLIDKRDERTKKRKAVKRKMDSVIGLSASEDKARHHIISLATEPMTLSDKSIRLLDEGYIDNGFVIKKGTLEKYLNGQNQYVRGWEFDGEDWKQTEVLNLTDDFVGTVNIGHQEFSTFPFLVGDWTRENLSLVETENDRHGIDVRLNLDEESIFVKELQRKPYDIGVSAEFWYHVNENDTEALSEMLGMYMPVLDEIFIFAYGLVGECGNVNSSGLELTKEKEMPEDIKTNIEELELGLVGDEEETESIELDVEVVAEEADEIELDAETETEIPPTDGEAESEEETAEEPTEEVEEAEEEVEEEQTEDEEEEVEEAEVEELSVDENDEDEDDSDEDDSLAETLQALQSQIETLTNTIKDLTEQNLALKKSNRKLSNKLSSERKKKEGFIENVKGLSVVLLPNEDKKEEEPKKESAIAYYNGDGIGEL